MLDSQIESLIHEAVEKKKYSLAQLISIFESSLKKHQSLKRVILTHELLNKKSRAMILGLAGPPGAGKSSLINAVVQNIVKTNQDISIAIVAIDPTSIHSKGSILGDRTRTKFTVGNKNIFFRSQPTDLELGGLGKNTFTVIRLLEKIFDLVIVETVGVGQSEIEIKYLADYTALIVQPFSGDQIQFIKSGIMEIPDLFVVNKSDDKKKSAISYNQLMTSLEFLNNQENQQDWQEKVFQTSCVTGYGIDNLVNYVLSLARNFSLNNDFEKYNYFFRKSIFLAYGEFGLAFLERQGYYMTDLGPYNYDSSLEQFFFDIKQMINQGT